MCPAPAAPPSTNTRSPTTLHSHAHTNAQTCRDTTNTLHTHMHEHSRIYMHAVRQSSFIYFCHRTNLFGVSSGGRARSDVPGRLGSQVCMNAWHRPLGAVLTNLPRLCDSVFGSRRMGVVSCCHTHTHTHTHTRTHRSQPTPNQCKSKINTQI